MIRRCVVNFRQGPPEAAGRPQRAAPSGLTIGAPVRLREFLRDGSGPAGPRREAVDRVLARFAADAPDGRAPEADGTVIVPVRFISACIVPGYWLDHSDPEHLRAAVPLFANLPVYTMHHADPRGWLGYAVDAAWDDAPLGAERVPGISGHVAIEGGLGEAQRVVARAVAMRSARRWSLGFEAEYEPSHDEMNDWGGEAWFDKFGTPAPDGTLFRFVVRAIPDVFEFSAVDVGAIESAVTADAPDHRAPKMAATTAHAAAVNEPARATPKSRTPFAALPVGRRMESSR